MITVNASQTFHLDPVNLDNLAEGNWKLPFDHTPYDKISAVRTDNGLCAMFVCRGYKNEAGKAVREVHVFYANGDMWYSYGTSVASAIQGAFADMWKQGLAK